jgi:hypothetical protein
MTTPPINFGTFAVTSKFVKARMHAVVPTFDFGNGARRSRPEELSGTSVRPRAAGHGPHEQPVEQSPTALPLEPQREPVPDAMTARALRTG